jgi:hypothetical protein
MAQVNEVMSALQGTDEIKEDYVGPIEKAVLAKPTSSTIFAELAKYESHLDNFNVVLNSLEDRLSAVLSPQFADDETLPKDPEGPKSELAHRFNNNNDRMSYALSRLQTLMDRVDL